MRRLLWAPLVLGLALLAGCGSDTGKLYPVSGKVTVDGQPLKKGSVRFVPDQGNPSKDEPTGEIKEDGTYTMTTKGRSGAPPGWYKVSVSSGEIPDSSKPNAPVGPFAAKYSNAERSGLKVEVVPSPAAGAYDLKLTAK